MKHETYRASKGLAKPFERLMSQDRIERREDRREADAPCPRGILLEPGIIFDCHATARFMAVIYRSP